ncbi:alpha/beta hydrolase [Agromyces sp. SYSU K20354]|uniref:alpha/beta fold hydrolase n=1 Tax=Agromyces cavernae TaxID=2898659 RepID=UPI001E2BF0E7|nr:alpha/beta hydrolase [Agromyces cavernae]MCD2443305.1 alpha/beta hydrolase [Agromyces cavernae]
METVRVDAIDVAYRRSGAGTPIVLLHSAFGDSCDWASDIVALGTDHEVVAWDAPGCGASSDVPAGWTDRDWSDALAGFITGLGLDRPVVCGLSLGSVMALLLARDHPRALRALVLAGAYAGWAGSLSAAEFDRRVASVEATIDRPPADWADAFLESVFPPDVSAERVAAARASLLAWRPATTRVLLSSLVSLDLRPALPHIDVPTLVVRGEADQRSPWRAALAIASTIPHARFVELPGLGHDCTGPGFDVLVRDFVARLPAAA